MSRRTLILAALCGACVACASAAAAPPAAPAALFAPPAAPAAAALMGVSHGYDLDLLWSRARKQFDLSEHDAVLLLEREHVSVLPGGGRRTLVQRVVWIGTAVGIREHADLRIPWNSAASSLEVLTLRTFMDGRWWPDPSRISPTAVVETLPFAIASACDYTPQRETMLLHDGVELPCIMETVYAIEERGESGDGHDGLYLLRRNDPAVLVEFALTLPRPGAPALHTGNGAPEPEIAPGEGTTTYLWRMERLERLGSPRIAEPALYAPFVAWSTWKDWNELGRRVVSSFELAAGGISESALADSLRARIEGEPSAAARARRVAALVNEWTRAVHYDSRFWRFAPRPAGRTYETAYGHALDRAVLAATLMRAAGLTVEPVYIAGGIAFSAPEVPGLARLGQVQVLVSGERLAALYDPGSGTLAEGERALYGRSVWKPASGEAPRLFEAQTALSVYNLALTLEPRAEGGWKGAGYLEAGGAVCPYGEMAGLGGQTRAFLSALAAAVLPGAEVGAYSLEVFGPAQVAAGFEFTLPAGKPDAQGRQRLVLGNPRGGIASLLSADVKLHHEQRGSPVAIPARALQRISLNIRSGADAIVSAPRPLRLENETGRFALNVEQRAGRLVLERELLLEGGAIPAEAWPALRALLLEEHDPAARTVIVR